MTDTSFQGMAILQRRFPCPYRSVSHVPEGCQPCPRFIHGRGAGGEGLELNASVARFNFGIRDYRSSKSNPLFFPVSTSSLLRSSLNSLLAVILAFQWLFF